MPNGFLEVSKFLGRHLIEVVEPIVFHYEHNGTVMVARGGGGDVPIGAADGSPLPGCEARPPRRRDRAEAKMLACPAHVPSSAEHASAPQVIFVRLYCR
jgi:hypothetical protein